MGRTRANRTIQGSLSVDGINKIISEIEKYKSDIYTLQDRFVRRLMSRGYEVARAYIQYAEMTADEDKPIGTLDIITDSTGEVSSCSLVFEGNQVLFVEFGAGITYNEGDPHPMAGQFGYGVGTFPHQKHANDKNGWSYYGNDDHWHHTKGTEATMPMYNASLKIRQDILQVAKEVFGSVK